MYECQRPAQPGPARSPSHQHRATNPNLNRTVVGHCVITEAPENKNKSRRKLTVTPAPAPAPGPLWVFGSSD